MRPLTPRVKAVGCVLLLFAFSFVAAAERKSDLFYEVLLSPFTFLGFPATYRVAFAVSAFYLTSVSMLATAQTWPLLRWLGWLLWLAHAAGVAWVLFWCDWHPFLTRLSLGIVLSGVFAAVYLLWLSILFQPLWANVRVPTTRLQRAER
jgi:hypothetical protein